MPTTLLTLPQSNLARNVTFDSLSLGNSVQLPADCASIIASLSLSAADTIDPVKSVTWDVYVSQDGATNWLHAYGPETWQGGTHTAHDGAPNVPNSTVFGFSIDPAWRGWFVRATGKNLGPTVRVGCTLVSNP
jgi:hypothetical protein